MTAIDTTILEEIADLDLTEFKAAYAVGNNVAVLYYSQLQAQGTAVGNANIMNYANLAKNVAGNEGANGFFANLFSKAVATTNRSISR